MEFKQLLEYISNRRHQLGESNPGILGPRVCDHPNKKHVFGRLAELDKLETFIYANR